MLQLPDDELVQNVYDALLRIGVDYNDEIDDEAYIARAVAWAKHFRDVGMPPFVVPDVYDAVVKARSRNSYRRALPNHEDFLEAWDKLLEDGYFEKRQQPEPDFSLPALAPGKSPLMGSIPTERAPNYVKTFAALSAMRGYGVSCDCEGDRWNALFGDGRKPARLIVDAWGKIWFVCSGDKCDFQHSVEDLQSLMPKPVEKVKVTVESEPNVTVAPVVEYDDDAILRELEARCEFNWHVVKRERAIAFARWLMEQAPVAVWSNNIARTCWPKFQDKNKADAETAEVEAAKRETAA